MGKKFYKFHQTIALFVIIKYTTIPFWGQCFIYVIILPGIIYYIKRLKLIWVNNEVEIFVSPLFLSI